LETSFRKQTGCFHLRRCCIAPLCKITNEPSHVSRLPLQPPVSRFCSLYCRSCIFGIVMIPLACAVLSCLSICRVFTISAVQHRKEAFAVLAIVLLAFGQQSRGKYFRSQGITGKVHTADGVEMYSGECADRD
jgi:hypothetical protein